MSAPKRAELRLAVIEAYRRLLAARIASPVDPREVGAAVLAVRGTLRTVQAADPRLFAEIVRGMRATGILEPDPSVPAEPLPSPMN
jgi:hypothetical protein